MDPNELKGALTGVISFPVTPYLQNLDVDYEGLDYLVRYLVDAGIHGIVACGGTGEFYSLTPEECVKVGKVAIDAVAGRVPVLVGVGYNARIGRELAVQAEKNGADGILVLPPYYTRPHDDGLLGYYKMIAEAVNIGVVVYSREWAAFTPDFVSRLAEIPNIVAYKEGQGDLRTFQAMRRRFGDRFAWIGGIGDDLSDVYLGAGAQAYTSSVSNYIPEVALAIYQAMRQGDAAKATDLLREHIDPYYTLRSKRKGYEVTVTKEAMNLLGLPAGPVRPPLPPLTADDRKTLQRILVQTGRVVPTDATGDQD